MDLELSRQGFNCLENILTRYIRKEESRESVVPDTKPDIGEVISTEKRLLIRSKDVSDGRVRVEAEMYISVLYRPESGTGAESLEMTVPFSLALEDECATRDSRCSVQLGVSLLDTRVLNPRKILVRAELEIKFDIFAGRALELPSALAQSEQCVYTRHERTEAYIRQSASEKTFALADEYILPVSRPAPEKLLSYDVRLETDEVKCVGSKIIVKGSVKVSSFYLSVEHELCRADFNSSFSQIIETGGGGERDMAWADVMLSGTYLEFAGTEAEDRTLRLEAQAVAQYERFERREIDYLSDIYSNRFPLEASAEESSFECCGHEARLRESARGKAQTDCPVAEILSAEAAAGRPESAEGALVLPLTVKGVFKSAGGELKPFSSRLELRAQTGAESDESAELRCARCEEAYAVPAEGGIELRVPVELTVYYMKKLTLTAVGAASVDTDERLDLSARASAVLARVSGEAELWSAAKANCSSVDAILAANGLASASDAHGEFLIVPKVV